MNVITVAAAIILNEQRQLLLVRKQNTSCFMQVGGKLEVNETAEQAMLREIKEEIGCEASIDTFIGRFETPTANEPDHLLVSYVYFVELNGVPHIDAEIAEMQWIDVVETSLTSPVALAPLTQDIVIPWVRQYYKQHALTS